MFSFFGWARTRRSRIELKAHSKRTMLRWQTKNLEVVNSRKTLTQDFENGHFGVSKARKSGPLCLFFCVSEFGLIFPNSGPISAHFEPGPFRTGPPPLITLSLYLSLSLFCLFYLAQPSFVFWAFSLFSFIYLCQVKPKGGKLSTF